MCRNYSRIVVDKTIHTRHTSKPSFKTEYTTIPIQILSFIFPSPASIILYIPILSQLLSGGTHMSTSTLLYHPTTYPLPSPRSFRLASPLLLLPRRSSLSLRSLPRSTTARRREARRGRAGGGRRWGAPDAGRWRRRQRWPWGSTPLSLAPPLLSPPQPRRRRRRARSCPHRPAGRPAPGPRAEQGAQQRRRSGSEAGWPLPICDARGGTREGCDGGPAAEASPRADGLLPTSEEQGRRRACGARRRRACGARRRRARGGAEDEASVDLAAPVDLHGAACPLLHMDARWRSPWQRVPAPHPAGARSVAAAASLPCSRTRLLGSERSEVRRPLASGIHDPGPPNPPRRGGLLPPRRRGATRGS
jgi:hypothetical protein